MHFSRNFTTTAAIMVSYLAVIALVLYLFCSWVELPLLLCLLTGFATTALH
jgi:hypothetical protein